MNTRRMLAWAKTIYLSPFTLLLMGGGSNSSSSSSKPLSAAERSQLLKSFMQNLYKMIPGMVDKESTGASGGPEYIAGPADAFGNPTQIKNPNYKAATNTYSLNSPEYTAPDYADPGAAQTLTGGDYDKLQADVLKGSLAGLDYSKNVATQGVNRDAAKRGIWSSGLAMQGEKDVENAYAPSYAKAGGDATSLVMGLKSGELKNLNDYALSNSGMKNSFGMENANRTYNAAWQPANFLKDAWNGTQGTISSGSGGGWNFSI
jgi:hypothetical protein